MGPCKVPEAISNPRIEVEHCNWRDWRRASGPNGEDLSNYEGAKAPGLGLSRQEEHSLMRLKGELSRSMWEGKRVCAGNLREAGRVDIIDHLKSSTIL